MHLRGKDVCDRGCSDEDVEEHAYGGWSLITCTEERAESYEYSEHGVPTAISLKHLAISDCGALDSVLLGIAPTLLFCIGCSAVLSVMRCIDICCLPLLIIQVGYGGIT